MGDVPVFKFLSAFIFTLLIGEFLKTFSVSYAEMDANNLPASKKISVRLRAIFGLVENVTYALIQEAVSVDQKRIAMSLISNYKNNGSFKYDEIQTDIDSRLRELPSNKKELKEKCQLAFNSILSMPDKDMQKPERLANLLTTLLMYSEIKEIKKHAKLKKLPS